MSFSGMALRRWFCRHWFRHIGAVVIPLVVIICHRPGRPEMPSYYNETASAPIKVSDSSALKEAREQFSERLKVYKDGNDSLQKNVYSWLVLIGLTCLILVRENQSVDFDIKGIKIPAGALHVFVVGSMLYLWIEFGITLSQLINQRMALWRLIDSIEGPLDPGRKIGLDSLRPLLEGQHFMDAWSAEFLREFSLYPLGLKPASAALLHTIVFAMAALVGLAHASALVVLEDARDIWNAAGTAAVFLKVAQCFVVAIVIGCYLVFQIARQGEWFFSVCAVWAGTWIEVLPQLKRLRSQLLKIATNA